MQNPPSYVQVDAAAGRCIRHPSLYHRGSPSTETSLDVNDIFGNSYFSHGVNRPVDSPSRTHPDHHPLHHRYTGKSSSVSNGMNLVPGLPSFSPQNLDTTSGSCIHPGVHGSNLNEAFMTSFGLTSGLFHNHYFTDRTRSPSPLHNRLPQNPLFGGSSHGYSNGDHNFIHDDLLLDSGPFRGLNLSTNTIPPDRHLSDTLLATGHLSRSLDDLSVVLDNSSDSVDLSLHRDSSSPDDSLSNDLTQSENPRSTASTKSETYSLVNKSSPAVIKQRKLNGRSDISRTCTICGKTFGNSSGLAKHRLTHSEERKYLCSVCMKSFKRQDHLSGHMLTHSDEKPFKCPVDKCGKSYCDSRSLKRHLDQHDPWVVPEEARVMFSDIPHELNDTRSLLDGSFDSSSRTNLKPFACQICKRKFKNNSALNGHMRLHGGFFNKKNGDVQPSAPPSISLAPLHDVDLSLMDLNDLPSCNDQQESFVWPGSTSTASREMLAVPTQINHVAVIKHVPATVQSSLRASLPPVSTLASPANSPTSLHAPYSFYSSSASSPTDLVQPEMAASPLKASPVSGISPVIFTVNGKVRRHSDSDNIVPPKRLKATVTDMLRHTINLNIARKLGSGYSENDLTASFSSHCGNFQEESPTEEGRDDDDVFQFPTVTSFTNGGFIMGSLVNSNDGEDQQEASPAASDDSIESPASMVSSNNSSNYSRTYQSSPDSLDSPSLSRLHRKHRPQPLFIPPPESMPTASNSLLSPGAGFPSRLRSPRFRDGTEPAGSLPPYTPPPMLSPNRSGSGLFWNVIQHSGNAPPLPVTTPQSGSKFLLLRSLSSSSTGHLDSQGGLHKGVVEHSEEVLDLEESPFNFGSVVDQPVATDATPRINIGSRHQADLPLFNPDPKYSDKDKVWEDQVWCPAVTKDIPDEQVRLYVAVGDSGAVSKRGRNCELAHHLLHITSGDVLQALAVLLNSEALLRTVPPEHPLRHYNYQNSDMWTSAEISAFSSALLKDDKDFFLVSNAVGSKTTKQCIQFYYTWKKDQPEEYRRMRNAAKRRRQQELITRSKSAATTTQQTVPETEENIFEPPKQVEPVKPKEVGRPKDFSGSYPCPQPGCANAFGTKQALSAHSRIHLPRSKHNAVTLDMCPPPDPSIPGSSLSSLDGHVKRRENNSVNNRNATQGATGEVSDFPCRLCGKVFRGVKSRNAHMKVHRLTENAVTNQSSR